MKGLILKDFLSIKNELKMFLIAGILYIMFAVANKDGSIISIIGLIASISMVATSISYDEKANFYSYAKGINLNPKDIVFSKFALGIIIGIFASLVSLIVNTFIQTDIETSMQVVGLILVGTILLTSLAVPIYLKFGVEKGKILNIIVILVPTILVIGLKDKIRSSEMISLMEFLTSYGIIIIGILGVLSLIASLIISVKIYENKEFN